MNAQSLRGSVALISGGLGDLGSATALELAKHGADIALGDLKPVQSFDDIKRDLNALGVRSHYQQIDVTDDAATQAWIDTVSTALGMPNLIVVNAGIVEIANFDTITPAVWRHQLDVNLNGAFYLAHSASRNLLKHKSPGRIVFIGSWAAHAPHPHIPAYCVSKAGLRSLCQNMALELAPHNILVNEVAPGTVNAGLSAQFFRKDFSLAEKQATKIPNRRLMESIDVAKEVLHLFDPEINHHVGSTVLVDGGNTLLGSSR